MKIEFNPQPSVAERAAILAALAAADAESEPPLEPDTDEEQ